MHDNDGSPQYIVDKKSRVIAAASLSGRIGRHFMIGESGQMPTQSEKKSQ
jgi:hypothetical protein